MRTNKNHLWIQSEHKQKTPVNSARTHKKAPVDSVRTQTKTPVDSVRTQTRSTQAQGCSAVLRPPYGTGCQTLHNTQDVAFSAAAEILFVFDSFVTYQPPHPPHRISFPTVPTASLSLQLPPLIAHHLSPSPPPCIIIYLYVYARASLFVCVHVCVCVLSLIHI